MDGNDPGTCLNLSVVVRGLQDLPSYKLRGSGRGVNVYHSAYTLHSDSYNMSELNEFNKVNNILFNFLHIIIIYHVMRFQSSF